MSSGVVEFDSAIKSFTEITSSTRIVYSKEFLLSIKHQIAPQINKPRAKLIFPKRTFNRKPEEPKQAENIAARNDLADGDKDEDAPKDIQEDNNIDLCIQIPEQSPPAQEEKKEPSIPPVAQKQTPKVRNIVPVVRTLRDIESKLNVKPLVHGKARIDTSAYYTLLGIVNDSLKHNTMPQSQKKKVSPEPNQATLKWIQSLRNLTSPTRKQESTGHRNIVSGGHWPYGGVAPMANQQQYLALLAAMQQSASLQMRQYMANWAGYQQHAMVAMAPPGLMPRGFDNRSHRVAMNELFQQSQLDPDTFFNNNLNKFGNFKRDNARHRPLVIVTPPASPSKK